MLYLNKCECVFVSVERVMLLCLLTRLERVPGVLSQAGPSDNSSLREKTERAKRTAETEWEGASAGEEEWMKNSYGYRSQKPFCLCQESSASNCWAVPGGTVPGIVAQTNTHQHTRSIEKQGPWRCYLGISNKLKEELQQNNNIQLQTKTVLKTKPVIHIQSMSQKDW